MAEQLSVDQIWKDIERYKRDALALHYEDYGMFRDFYRGGSDILKYIRKSPRETVRHWSRRKERLVGVSYCGTIVDKVTRSQVGKEAQIQVGDENDDRWGDIAKFNHWNTYHTKSTRQRNIDGNCIMMPQYMDGEIKLTHVLPEHFYPVLGDSYEDVQAVIIDKRYDGATYMKANSFEKEKGRIWIYTPDEIALFEDGEMIERDFNPMRDTENPLHFVMLNGKALIGDFFGQSEIHSVAYINKAINMLLNSAVEIIHFQAFSLLIIQSALSMPTDEKGNPKLDASMQNFIRIDPEGKAYFISPDPKIDEICNFLDKLIKTMFEVGGVPQVAINAQDSHSESGLSRKVQFMPLIDKIEELRTFDSESLKKLVTTCIQMKDVYEGKQPTEVNDIDIEWSDNYLPEDEGAVLEQAMMMEEGGFIKHLDNLRQFHPDKSDEELEEYMTEIEEEQMKKLEQTVFNRDDFGKPSKGEFEK